MDDLDRIFGKAAGFSFIGPGKNWMDPGPPLTVESFRKAVAQMRESLQPNAYILSPKQWEWYKWAMDQLGVHTIEEVWAALADEDRWFAYLASMGWRNPPPTS